MKIASPCLPKEESVMKKSFCGFVVFIGCVVLAASCAQASGKAESYAEPTHGTSSAASTKKIATPHKNAASGGVRVAAGDLNGDGASSNAANRPGVTLAPAQKPPSALLLPAVQKVREAASR
jgi:hypothetical protein